MYVLWVNSFEIKRTPMFNFSPIAGLRPLAPPAYLKYSNFVGIAFPFSIWKSSSPRTRFLMMQFSWKSYKGKTPTISVLKKTESRSFWKFEALILFYLESFWFARTCTIKSK